MPPERIAGHRDWANTTCPGENMYWRLAGLVEAATAPGAVELSYLRDAAAVNRVAEISRLSRQRQLGDKAARAPLDPTLQVWRRSS